MAKRPDLELMSNQSDEPIFIKNLENVQGDERDVILFSVGYGPDKNGHVSMNFGPLNNEGGERRLNVAVSRARYEMMVFSTLKAEQIDLRRSNAKGVVGLKRFLEFAAKGMQVLPTVTSAQMQASEIINDLADALQEKGYQVDKMVGKSNFRIDLAVVDPRDSDKYLLGILTDGKSYYNTKTTRDREICQPNVLRMLNWNFMRVWSVDWFQNRERVLASIIEKLYDLQHPEQAKKQHEEGQPAQLKLFSIADEPVAKAVNLREKVYKTASLRASTAQPDIERVMKNEAKVKDQLRQIITVEQPVTNNYLYKRIANLWNMQRVTPRLQSFVDSLLQNFYLDPMSDGKNNVYWIDKVVAFDYSYYRVESKRDIADVPLIELMNAALYAVEQQISIPREDLKKVISTLLGFSRKGANVDMAAEKAVNTLISMGKLKEEFGKITFNN
jgi:very-short-patch-repair endonuclease